MSADRCDRCGGLPGETVPGRCPLELMRRLGHEPSAAALLKMAKHDCREAQSLAAGD